MESTILSTQNIENIYEYVNTELVKKHNINLNDEDDNKYKKIVKKLTKTVLNHNKNKLDDLNLDSFNNLVIDKSVPFIVNYIQESTLKQHVPKKSKKKNQYTLGAYGEQQLTTQRNLLKSNNDTIITSRTPGNYNTFLESQSSFDNLVKESNKRIKDNFKKFLKKDTFQKDVECSNTNNPFVLERCVLKDEVDSNLLDDSAFEKIMEKKMEGPVSTTQISSEMTTPEDSLRSGSNYDNYDQINVKDLLTKVIVNQKDHSKGDQLESYHGEEYLPNYTSAIGEDAEIQPLLYQNTGQGTERIDKKIFVIDTGTKNGGKLDLTTDPYNTITNLGTATNFWHKFRAKLDDTIKIDKLTDVYLRSFSIIGATSNLNAGYFCLGVEEFNIRTLSNNPNMKNKIIIKNTNTVSDSSTAFMSVNYPSMSNFVTTINPISLFHLNFTLTNENNESVDDGAAKVFHTQTANTNRVIFELEFVSRDDRDTVIS